MEGGKVLPGLSQCSERSNESVDSAASLGED